MFISIRGVYVNRANSGLARYPEWQQIIPVVCYNSLSCSGVFRILAWHHCAVPEMAVLLCVLTCGSELCPHSVVYFG